MASFVKRAISTSLEKMIAICRLRAALKHFAHVCSVASISMGRLSDHAQKMLPGPFELEVGLCSKAGFSGIGAFTAAHPLHCSETTFAGGYTRNNTGEPLYKRH